MRDEQFARYDTRCSPPVDDAIYASGALRATRRCAREQQCVVTLTRERAAMNSAAYMLRARSANEANIDRCLASRGVMIVIPSV